MRDPAVIRMSPKWLRDLHSVQSSVDGVNWHPARPLGYSSILHRIKATWLVWTGRADALIWPGGQ